MKVATMQYCLKFEQPGPHQGQHKHRNPLFKQPNTWEIHTHRMDWIGWFIVLNAIPVPCVAPGGVLIPLTPIHRKHRPASLIQCPLQGRSFAIASGKGDECRKWAQKKSPGEGAPYMFML